MISSRTASFAWPSRLLAASLIVLAILPAAVAQTPTPRVAAMSTLYEFPHADGHPVAALIRARDGCFYGTTTGQGKGNYGTVFKLTPAGEFSILHRFAGPEGAVSNTSLLQGSDGALYGTAGHGGASSRGTIFRLALDGTCTTLHSFTGPDGSRPDSALIQAHDGFFYGVTRYGGNANGGGTIFRLAPDGTLTTLHRFDGPDGAHPVGALLPAPDGSFYGVAHDGGAHSYGTIFQLSAAGDFSTVHDFSGQDGDGPIGPLLLARNGSIYGVTHDGGDDDYGTVFKLTPDGTLTTLQSFFTNDPHLVGDTPQTSLIQGRDGFLYGSTEQGGYYNNGTLFRIAPDDTLGTLYQFGFSGYHPHGALLQAGSDFYGITTRGGQFEGGTIFRYTPNVERDAPTVTLSAPVPETAVGSEVSGEFRVTLSRASAYDLTVVYAVRGDALPSVDYSLLRGTVTIKAGQTGKTIHVAAQGNLNGAASKTVLLKLARGNGYLIGTTKGVKIQLVNPSR